MRWTMATLTLRTKLISLDAGHWWMWATEEIGTALSGADVLLCESYSIATTVPTAWSRHATLSGPR